MSYIKRRAKVKLTEKELENIDSRSTERLLEAFHNSICIGDDYYFTLILDTLNKRNEQINYKSYLEYALVYGRHNILSLMLSDSNFQNILQSDYDPYCLEDCEPAVYNDIFEGSWWGNDEHERSVVNRMDISHIECFNLLKPFGKQLTKSTIKKWIDVSYGQLRYFNGYYFCDLKKLINSIFQDTSFSIKELIMWMEEIDIKEDKQKLKILSIVIGHDKIIEVLKQ